MLARRKPRPDRARALSRSDVERLLTREDITLRERTLWRMAYETAARSAGLLALDVGDLDLAGPPRQGLREHGPRRRLPRHCLPRVPRRTPTADISPRAVHPAAARSSPVCTAASRGGDDLEENIMDTITTQLADCLHGERLCEADRARLAVSARAARRSARRACPAVAPASRIIRAVLLRPAV
jgi:hypothetical protein